MFNVLRKKTHSVGLKKWWWYLDLDKLCDYVFIEVSVVLWSFFYFNSYKLTTEWKELIR